jgi:transposase-like protein
MVDSLPYDERKGCPDGFHKRSSFTSKRGHRVPPRCVKAQTVYKETRRNYSRRILQGQQHRLDALHKPRTSTMKCPPGKMVRHGYVRRFGTTVMRKGYTVKRALGKHYHIKPAKKSVYVKPSCVKDKGDPRIKAPGPGKGIGLLRKGELKKHGYVYLKHTEERHNALRKAIKEFGVLGVYHKLDAIAKLSKHSVPAASRIFKEDREWLQRHYKLVL